MEAVSIKESQMILGLGRTSIYQLLSEGKIQGLKCGRRTLILKEELENFLNNLEPYKKEDV